MLIIIFKPVALIKLNVLGDLFSGTMAAALGNDIQNLLPVM
jgi:hypothetical protein